MTPSDFESWQAAFERHVAHTSPEPIGLVVDRALGPWVYAADGKRYLDLLSGIGVANIGHTHPDVVEAVAKQSARHHHVMVYGEYVQETQALYAAELAAVLPNGLDSVFFVNSGTEAIEGALKLARKATGRSGFVAFEGGYHGDTMGALSIGGIERYRAPFEPLLSPVIRLPFGSTADLNRIDDSVAAVIVEPVQSEAGVRVPPPDFLPALEQRCHKVGALLIADEVMTGFGRTGRLFAVERWDVVPDLTVLAKALGGGYPLGALAASRNLLRAFTEDPPLSHVTTFGGHPVSCAAGRASLRVIMRDRLAERADQAGARFRERLVEAFRDIRAVREVRGLGLLIGIEFEEAAITHRFVERCRERGLLLGWTLAQDQIVRLCPPLNIPEELLVEAAASMKDVLVQTL
jgi:acetylornithine/succinyldiaminopimelate/putrescine aminotransferase